MTSIATKGGAVIVKGGAAAEVCSCCGVGDWQCCTDISCLVESIKGVAVSITAKDYVRKWQYENKSGNYRLNVTQAFKGDTYSGSWNPPLTSSPAVLTQKTFSMRFPSNPAGCFDNISVTIAGSGVSINFTFNSFAYLQTQPLHLPGTPDFKDPGYFSCVYEPAVTTAMNFVTHGELFAACQGSVVAYGPYSGTCNLAYPSGTVAVPESSQTVVSETGSKSFSIDSVVFSM